MRFDFLLVRHGKEAEAPDSTAFDCYMILVDTSVWIDHLRKGDRALTNLLEEGEVAIHPFVIGELACGNLRNRSRILSLLSALPSATIATHEETLRFLTERKLSGKGIDWIDTRLLAAALLSEAPLWTRDKPLTKLATSLGVSCGRLD